MKKLAFLFTICMVLQSCNNSPTSIELITKKGEPSLIPEVKKLKIGEGSFSFSKSTEIHFSESQHRKDIFSSTLSSLLKTKNSGGIKNHFYFKIEPNKEALNLNPEAYKITINPNSTTISSSSEIGLFWGLQSFSQLCFQYQKSQSLPIDLPEVTITDEPRFEHRGMLLDVCRHFFNEEVVKKYIDLLAYYKMNVLHWHLTEDQAWRIEIDQYPELTKIGAWRKDSSGQKYGGFYTKAVLRDIVNYAQKRNVTIIPEIELPGHSQAAIAAYPYLSCTGDSVEVANDWGVFKEIYCAGNDSTFTFIENVLTEVLEIFPSKYIHIGGDEAPKFRWENCSKCQKRIKHENLKDEHELQSYFITRVEKFLNKNGRKLIGWDEILEGGLSPNATVQSWRGMEHGKTAAEQNHKVIMSPTSHCYFDYNLKSIDLKKVYSFNPIPDDLEASQRKFIIGGECNMWTEHVPKENNLDSKVFPRLLAMSEVLWSYPEIRDFSSFYKKVQNQYSFLESRNVAYGLEAIPAKIVYTFLENGDPVIQLKPEFQQLDLKFRKSENESFISYNSPFPIDFSGDLEVQASKNGKNYGPPIRQKIMTHAALFSHTSYSNKFNEWYEAGGEMALVNGFLGSLDFRDGNWQGFFGEHLEIVLEFEEKTSISDIWANFYQYNNAWIFLPKKVEVFTSQDGKIWEKQTVQGIEDKSKIRGQFIESVKLQIYPQVETKFVKFRAENFGAVPDWHEAAGSKSWIFIDEIIVQ